MTDMNSALTDPETGKFFYSGDEVSINLFPVTALIIVGILRKN